MIGGVHSMVAFRRGYVLNSMTIHSNNPLLVLNPVLYVTVSSGVILMLLYPAWVSNLPNSARAGSVEQMAMTTRTIGLRKGMTRIREGAEEVYTFVGRRTLIEGEAGRFRARSSRDGKRARR